MQYYDLQKNWRKVRRHLANEVVVETLVADFNKFTFGRWETEFKPGMYPAEFESCDWHVGKRNCAFHRYVKHAACHWLVNFALELAQLVEPDRDWRIITSQKHSTVWDGVDLLFDFNFQALGIPADEAFTLARSQRHSRMLRPGHHLKTHLARHYLVD